MFVSESGRRRTANTLATLPILTGSSPEGQGRHTGPRSHS